MSGAVQSSGSLAKLLQPGIRHVTTTLHKMVEKFYSHMFHTIKSNRNFEEFVMVTGYPIAQDVDEGSGISYTRQNQGFTTRIYPKQVGLGVILTEVEESDNLYKNALKRARLLEFSFIQKLEYDAHFLLNNATVSAANGGANYGDGQPLCSASHPVAGLSGGLISNLLATPAPLAEASLEDMLIQIELTLNQDGFHVVYPPKDLIVQSSQRFNAQRIYKSLSQPGTANNDVNAMSSAGKLPRLIITPYLTAPNAWFVTTRTPDPEEGLILIMRKELDTKTDNDVDTRNYKLNRMMRYAFSAVDTSICIFMSNAS